MEQHRDRWNRGSGGRGGGFREGPDTRKKHKAKCSECGKDCEVPFKPTEGKPVYCKECYRKRRSRY